MKEITKGSTVELSSGRTATVKHIMGPRLGVILNGGNSTSGMPLTSYKEVAADSVETVSEALYPPEC